MSTPYGFCITRQGNSLLARLLSSEQLEITRVMIGGGKPAEDANLMDLENLIEPIAEATSTIPLTIGTTTSFIIEYRNDMGGDIREGLEGPPGEGLSRDISINEFAVFANDPENGEIMLYYGCLGDYPDTVKAYTPGDPVISRRYPVSITVVEGVEVILGYAAGAYMTAEDIAEYCQKSLLPQFLTMLPGEVEEQLKAHNQDPNAHPSLTARTSGLEVALNGSVTLTGNGDPTSETVGKKGQHYINLQTGQEFVCTDDQDGTYTWTPDNSEKSLRDILEDAKNTADAAKKVADGAAQAIAAVQNTISVIPSQAGSLTYNKTLQKPSWNNLALEMMTITYGAEKTAAESFQGETDAGTYKAYVTPKEPYTWGDKSKDEKEITWTIQRATIATVPSVKTPLTYTGVAQTPEWNNYNAEQLTKEETAQTNAGDHSTSFTPTKNYQWNGGDTSAKVVKWTIAPKTTSFSMSPNTSQSLNVGDTQVIKVTSDSDANIAAESSNTAAATVAVDQSQKTVTITGAGQGTANITISCKGSTNYTDASAVISVNVNRKNPSLSFSPAGDKTISIGGSTQLSITTDSDGTVSASSNTPGVATAAASGKTVTISGASAGNATVTISVPQTTKYNAASVTLQVTVSKPTVSNSSWADIKAISDAGNAASYFSVGDTKEITINGTVAGFSFSSFKINAFIIGINHNSSREGGNSIHWQIGKVGTTMTALCDSKYNTNGSDAGFRMNQSNSNTGGWQDSYMRKTVLGNSNVPTNPLSGSLMAALPEDLRKVMKPVTKYTDNKGNHSSSSQGTNADVTTTTDYLFLLAEFEVFGTRSGANQYEQNYQEQYSYYKANNSKVANRHDNLSSAVWWWLRSCTYDGGDTFRGVNTSGGYNASAYYSGGVAPGFST